jgi:hypothetical protein
MRSGVSTRPCAPNFVHLSMQLKISIMADNHKRDALAAIVAIALDMRGIDCPTEDEITHAVVKAYVFVQAVDISPDVGFEAVKHLVALYSDARRDCPWKCGPDAKACLCTAGVARAMVARLGK